MSIQKTSISARRTRGALGATALAAALLATSLHPTGAAADDSAPGTPVEGPVEQPVSSSVGPSPEAERAAARTEGGGDVPWRGYALAETSAAASSWVGARRIPRGRSVATVFRTDPTRTRASKAFDDGHWVTRWQASDQGPLISGADTACAAQLLGRFGTTPDDLQLAGLDVAVYHLLYGKGYTVGGSDQIARTDQRENGPTIRAYGKKLISEYCAESGPYQVTLTASRSALSVGGTVSYTATVKSRAGIPMTKRTISVRIGASSTVRDYDTNSRGQATFSTKTTASGPLKVSLVVRDLPYTKLRYFAGTADGASRVVQAGLKMKRAYPRAVTVKVKGRPVITGGPDRTVTARQFFRIRFAITKSYPVSRSSTVRLYGPYSSGKVAAADRCSASHLLEATRVPVRGDATYRTKSLKVARAGVYVWRVDVAADPSYNASAKICGRPFAAKASS